MGTKYDWPSILKRIEKEFSASTEPVSYLSLSRFLDIKKTTLIEGLRQVGFPSIEDLRRHLSSRGPESEPEPKSGENEDFIDGNGLRHVSMVTDDPEQITSIDESLAFFKVDMTKWRIKQAKVNSWPMGRKDKKSEITWNKGVTDGYIVDSGEVKIRMLYQVTVLLEPLVIEPIEVPIKFANIVTSYVPKKEYKVNADWGRGLFLSDPHIGYRKDVRSGQLDPFHDRRAMDVVVKIVQAIAPDIIGIGGDYLDCTEFTHKYHREPEFSDTFGAAILEGAWWLSLIREMAPDAKIVMLGGNHEQRTINDVADNYRTIYRVSSMENVHLPAFGIQALLGLGKLGVDYIEDYPEGEMWFGPVKGMHGDIARSVSPDSARGMLATSLDPVVFGHIHRLEQTTRVLHEGGKIRVISAVSSGALCRMDYVVPGHTRTQNWSQGVTLIDWNDKNWQITPVAIQGGEAIYEGSLYTGDEEISKLIAQDLSSSGYRF